MGRKHVIRIRWEETSHLNQVGTIRWERRKKEGNKKKKKERKEKKEEEKRSEKLHLISRIYGDRAVGFRRSKRQSSFTRRELCVGTRIQGFHQNFKGRGFSPTLVIFGIIAI